MQTKLPYKVLEKTDNKIAVKVENPTGDAVFTVYKVFSGVELIFNEVHIDKCSFGMERTGNLMVIHHCREGRMERIFDDGYFYLSAGDMAVVKRHKVDTEFEFPLRHYHGVSVVIDTDLAPKCFSCFMKDVDIRPLSVAEKLCNKKDAYIARSEKYIEHIFSELYSVPENIRKGFFKVKILELLLVLSSINPELNEEEIYRVPSEQVRLAKDIKKYLSDNMDSKITIAELAQKFFVSESNIKNSFKSVYGVPVYSFMRVQKMQSAAIRLIHTDNSITDIALEYGYDNTSKFASAFKEVMGDTPNQYRKDHKQF